MEYMDQFVGDGVFLVQRVIFQGTEEVWCVNNSGIEEIACIGWKEQGKYMALA